MKDVGIGVVGLGRLGALHAHNVAWRTPHAKLIAVCDMVGDLASKTASELGCKYYTDINKMLEDINALPRKRRRVTAYPPTVAKVAESIMVAMETYMLFGMMMEISRDNYIIPNIVIVNGLLINL